MKVMWKFLAINLFLTCAASTAFAQNYKIKQVMTMNGQKISSTVYVKGARKRTEGGGIMGIGGDVATVEQCDLKRNIKISDKKKMYAVEPFDDGTDTISQPNQSKIQNPKSKIEKGGTVTYISNITDTGERKQMFGLTARHVKTSMTMQASPDACMKQDMKIETDGWYIDLPQFSCPMTSRPEMPQYGGGNTGGCRDKMIFKTSGGGKTGFPLTETRTMNMGDEGMSMTQTLETLEFSKATLDDALFDIPGGYTLTANSQELYGKPDYTTMMKAPRNDNADEDKPTTSSTKNNNSMLKPKKTGVIRIGVYAPTNRAGENVSTTNLQMFLVQKLTGGNIEAVAVGSETDARTANCDYVLTSDFSKLKQSTASKVGGMFGKITNTDTSGARNYDAQVDFSLVPLNGGKTVQNKASNKTESEVGRAAEAVLALEAQQIFSAIQK
jgi:hypothetical protein